MEIMFDGIGYIRMYSISGFDGTFDDNGQKIGLTMLTINLLAHNFHLSLFDCLDEPIRL